jgi:hypothetical protein
MYRGNLLNQEFQNAWNRNMQQVAVGQEGSRQLVDLMTARASALAAGDIAKANALTDMISGIQGGIEGVMDFKKLQEMINGPNVTAPDSAYSRIPIPDPSSVGPITSTIAGLGGAAAAGTAAGLGGGAGVTGTIGATTFPNVLGAAGAVGSGGAAAAPGAIGAAGTTGSGGLLGAIGSTAGNVGTSVGTLGGLVPLAVGIPIIGGAIAAAIILPKLFGNGPDRMAANELTESGGLHDYIVEGINKLNADQSLTPEQKAETQEAIARQVEDYLVEFSKIDKHHYYQAKQTLIDMQWLGVKPLLGDPEAEFKAMIANLGDKLAPLGNRLREDLRRLI